MFSGGSKGNIGKIWVKIGTLKTDDYIINKINRSLYIFCELEEMTNNFQINTVYSDLLSKVHYQSESLFTNQKSKKPLLPLATFQ